MIGISFYLEDAGDSFAFRTWPVIPRLSEIIDLSPTPDDIKEYGPEYRPPSGVVIEVTYGDFVTSGQAGTAHDVWTAIPNGKVSVNVTIRPPPDAELR